MENPTTHEVEKLYNVSVSTSFLRYMGVHVLMLLGIVIYYFKAFCNLVLISLIKDLPQRRVLQLFVVGFYYTQVSEASMK